MRKILGLFILSFLFIPNTSFMFAQQAKISNPKDVGMSDERLKNAHNLLQNAVSSKTIGSAVGLIARSKKIVFLDAVGEAGRGVPMPKDAIVRLASICKPITATAVLMLYERGKLRLSDPVEKYIPEFRNLKVAVPTEDGKSTRLVEANRAITIYDLLTHQAGLEPSWDYLDKEFAESKTSLDFSQRVVKYPLKFQPGTNFEYGPSYDVLAAIIEKITGQTLDEFLTKELLQPLKMKDTYFHVPEEKRNRMSAVYRNGENGSLTMIRKQGEEEPPTQFFSGGGSLRSTVQDYYRFAQMLLNGGELNGVRILSPKSVQLMTTNHVGSMFDDAGGYGWGFGVSVQTNQAVTELGSVGAYGWNGGSGTLFLVDPAEKLIVIIFAPSHPRTPGVYELRKEFVTSAYQAIEESYQNPK